MCGISGQVTPDEDSLTMIVKGVFSLKAGATSTILEEDDGALPMGDIFFQDNDTASLAYASDFVLFKHHGDILLTGTCHVPGGNPQRGCEVTLGVGGWRKSLSVFGDRFWVGGKASEPQLFTSMPLNYENAFGGTGFDKNPVGKGMGDITTLGGQILHPLPNIENCDHYISSPNQRIDPAGFGPLRDGWGDRAKLSGTYGADWLKNNWPHLPPDFDWGYYNGAPRDQQVKGYFRGDETLLFENMHAEHAQYSSALPGLRPRLFMEEGESFQEVSLNLDTMWIDMDTEKLVLVWRGLAGVPSSEETCLFLTQEDMTEERKTAEHYHQHMQEISQEEGFEPESPQDEVQLAEEAEEDPALTKEMEKTFGDIRGHMEKTGVPDNLVAMIGADMDYDAFLDKFVSHYNLDVKDGERFMAEARETQKIQMRDALEKAGEDPNIIDELDEEDADEGEKEWAEESLRARIESGQGFEDEDLSEVNMAGWNLDGVNFRGADLSGADLSGCSAKKSVFDDVIADQIDLSRADLTGVSACAGLFSGAKMVKVTALGAKLPGADFSDAVLAGANFDGADLTGAMFDRADLSLACLTKISGEGASFIEARLKEADFSEAHLKEAIFTEADMGLANFNKADLTTAVFETVQAEAVKMTGAILTGLRAGEGSHFQNSVFKDIQGQGSIWVGADLMGADYTGSQMDGADFTDAKLTDAIFCRVSLKESNFTSATMLRSKMSSSNFFHSTFESADLTQADFSHSNLYGSEVWKAVVDGALFDGANLKMTKLAQGGFF